MSLGACFIIELTSIACRCILCALLQSLKLDKLTTLVRVDAAIMHGVSAFR